MYTLCVDQTVKCRELNSTCTNRFMSKTTFITVKIQYFFSKSCKKLKTRTVQES